MSKSSNINRMSFFFVLIVTILLIILAMSLYQVIVLYIENGTVDILSTIFSIGAISIAVYMLLQIRRKPLRIGFKAMKVLTTIQCSNCDFKDIREFHQGDYIFKEIQSCPKCNNKAIVSSIYRMMEKKEK